MMQDMKKYRNANDTMRVGAYEENGKYIIIINKERKMLVATKGSSKAHVETYYTDYRKEFDNPHKANRYFKGIKANNPTLVRFE